LWGRLPTCLLPARQVENLSTKTTEMPMRHAWSATLKLVAVAALLFARYCPQAVLAPVLGLALAAALTAVTLDILDWRAGRRLAAARLVGGVLALAAAGFVISATLIEKRTAPPPQLPETALDVHAFGFRLKSPGPGWVLLSKDDLPSPPHATDVQAGADYLDGIEGVVLVVPLEKMAGGGDAAPNLDGLVLQHKATIDWAERRQLSYETVPFAGREARQYVIRGVDGAGRAMLGQATLFVRGPHVYILAVVGPEDRCRPNDPRFRAFADAFELPA
jgi:hypothetical protein